MGINMDMVLGEMVKVKSILETGEIIRQMVKELIHGLMVISMKEIGWIS